MPETLRPWALPGEARDTSADGDSGGVQLPLRPLLSAWVKITLAAASLASAGAVGLALGRGPLAPRAAVTVAPPGSSTATATGARAGAAPPPSRTLSVDGATVTMPSVPEATEPALVGDELSPPPEEGRGHTEGASSSAAMSTSSEALRGDPARTADAARAAPRAADLARIESVARAVRLDDEDGGGLHQHQEQSLAAEPDGG